MYPQNSQFEYGPSWAGSDGAKGAFGAAGMMEARRRRAARDGDYAASSGNGGPGFLAGLDIGGRRRKHMEATFDRIGQFAELEHKLSQGTMTHAAGLETGLQNNATANEVTKIGARSKANMDEVRNAGRVASKLGPNSGLTKFTHGPAGLNVEYGPETPAKKTPARPGATANPTKPAAQKPKPAAQKPKPPAQV